MDLGNSIDEDEAVGPLMQAEALESTSTGRLSRGIRSPDSVTVGCIRTVTTGSIGLDPSAREGEGSTLVPNSSDDRRNGLDMRMSPSRAPDGVGVSGIEGAPLRRS